MYKLQCVHMYENSSDNVHKYFVIGARMKLMSMFYLTQLTTLRKAIETDLYTIPN